MLPARRPAFALPGRALPLLAGMLIAGFGLQVAGEAGWQAAASWSEATLGLTPTAWAAGEYWRLATHGLVHSTTNLFHLGLVLAAILGPGAALARELGPRLPLAAWVTGQVLGGLCWLGFHREAGAAYFGATAGPTRCWQPTPCGIQTGYSGCWCFLCCPYGFGRAGYYGLCWGLRRSFS